MKAVDYKVKHQYQPTNSTCSPTALSILLSHYGKGISVAELSRQIPQVKDENGKNAGTINQQMATWCLAQGFEVTLYTFDCQIIDQSWSKLPKDELLNRLEARKNGWQPPALGKLWTAAYAQSYIDFLKAGGKLVIRPALTTKLLYKLLEVGPVLPCLSFSTLYGEGRTRHDGEKGSIPDDVNGHAWNHSIVIHGVDEKDNFLIADPWQKPGHHSIEPERMTAAISTAQIECDNLVFQLKS